MKRKRKRVLWRNLKAKRIEAEIESVRDSIQVEAELAQRAAEMQSELAKKAVLVTAK